MRRFLSLALLAGITLFAACSDDTTGPGTNNTGTYTISGKLRFDSAIALPANPHVQVMWDVSSGSPDYVYAFGHGTVNMADSTFKVVFNTPPPADAINSYGLGVGNIVLIPEDVPEGKLELDSLFALQARTLGIAEDYGVIYLSKSPDSVALARSWAKDFKQGFNAGKGVRKDQGFDEFTPTEPNLIEIVIDALDNLEWVNWT